MVNILPQSLQEKQVARDVPVDATGHMEGTPINTGTIVGVTLLCTTFSKVNVPRPFKLQQQHGRRQTSLHHPKAASLTKFAFPLLFLRYYPPLTVWCDEPGGHSYHHTGLVYFLD